MRRMSTVHAARGGQVAIYDALLFLMVVILVSVGMFLYSAKLTSEGAGFDGGTYERLAREQLDATEGLIVDTGGLYVNVTKDNVTTGLLLVDADVPYIGPWTVEKVLHGYLNLTKRFVPGRITYDLTSIEPRLVSVFNLTRLNATHFAWAFEVGGKVVMFSSDSPEVTGRDDLPPVHYSASALLQPDSPSAGKLCYYLWLA